MGLRDYRGYDQVKPQRREQGKEEKQRSKKLYLERQARKKRRNDKKIRSSVLLVSALIFIAGAFTISRDINIYKSKNAITKLQSDAKIIKEKNEDLKIKLLQNSSLEKIEKIARERLKMIDPNGEDIMDFNNPNESKLATTP